MTDFFATILPNLPRAQAELWRSLVQTVQMVLGSGAISFVIGLFFGVALVVTKRGGILQNLLLNGLLDRAINILRSIPFLILIILLIPLSRLITGTAIGVTGALVPLVFGTVPFFSRQVEAAISEVDAGLGEASAAMGLSPLQIIFRVYLRESIPTLTRVTQITAISLLNLSTMAGAIGAGGLGDFAIRFGHQQRMGDLMWLTIGIILLLVTIVQVAGNIVIKKTDKVKRGE